MTGRTDRIIQSGRVPERRNASMRRSRLIAFLRRWPELVRTSTWRVRASSSRSIRLMISRTASAPMPALKSAAALGARCRSARRGTRNSVSPSVIIGLRPSISSRDLAQLVLAGPGPAPGAARARGGASRRCRPAGRRPSGRPRAPRPSRAAGARRSPARSRPTILRRRAVASLPPLSPAATTTSPVGAKAIDSSAVAGLELGQPGLDLLGGSDDLLGPRGALRLEVGLRFVASSAVSSSFRRFRSARSSSSSSVSRSPAFPPRPSASSSSAWRARLRASSST